MSRQIRSLVMLKGTPPFALSYFIDNVEVPMDLLAFRPDPQNYLTPGQRYPAVLTFVDELDYERKHIAVLTEVHLSSVVLKKIR